MEKKTIVIPTGFYNTGSSVVTNILQEMDGVSTIEGVNEWRILYDPDCIRDLEYHLLENPHRQNTAYALRRFKDYIDFNSKRLLNHHYEQICAGSFKTISYEYINSISEFVYHGASHLDIKEKGQVFWFVERCYSKLIRLLFSTKRPSWVRGSLISNKTTQFAGTFNKERFYNATKVYIGKILEYVNTADSKCVVADQFLPPSAINAYLNYFPSDYDVKVVVVDRDPRDLYFTCKFFLHTKAIPTKSIREFCDWYKWTRGQSEVSDDNDSIMRIRFEDAIYEYETTRRRLLEFCGNEKTECISQYKYFDPSKSINNTQVWKRYPGNDDSLQYIQKELDKYCYRFEEKEKSPDFKNGKIFDC